jgi:hypothetical protein
MAIDYAFGIKILFIAGITNILFLLLVLFSCRCIGMSKTTKKLYNYRWFQKFNKYHCWYWYGFIISVLIHTILAFMLFRIPF